ncbi:Serine/threonine-protein kinase pkn1 [Crateriforma conspicua]|uniref:Serine/threonine-protein kinase pkn1 n=1 Tax=Crateriforma conspicua TaxID=2527996 RepID=A0A5C5Y082_9PLAN|nr:Serine/threonine-protein kinase pkn1 [Crateriforma conspicua]
MPPIRQSAIPFCPTYRRCVLRHVGSSSRWCSAPLAIAFLCIQSATLLCNPAGAQTATSSPDNAELLTKIHQQIVEASGEVSQDDFKNYRQTIPRTGVEFEMVAVPGGSFTMGSPEDEEDREDNEGPQQQVTVSPFWMGKCEVTWDEYEPYMITQAPREKNGARKDYDPATDDIVDGVSQPTPPYTEMSFGMGQTGYPAISMTQHAANKYCQWLSAQTGHFYRLPTEAEWEYACRAGTTGPYSFDADAMEDYAWFYDNSDDKYQQVGQLKPNPFGLHDMHGNVMEWTADQYEDDYFDRIADNTTDPIVRPIKLYPRSVRGGSWYDDPEQLRSAYRRGSDPSWKDQDPQLPRSIWYHTDALWVGFRVVRPMQVPDVKTMDAFWNSATDAR